MRSKRLFILAVGLGCSILVLSGCAPQLVGANEAGGLISNVRTHGLVTSNVGDAYSMANAQCARYGKVARINANIAPMGDATSTIAFECVPQ